MKADGPLSKTDAEEALSLAYVNAVAAYARYSTSKLDFDRDGVDLRIQGSGRMHPALELQLKATVNLVRRKDGLFRFDLKRRNYDLLREDAQTPRLLVVLHLPKDERRWLTIEADRLVLRHLAYWANLKGMPDSRNKRSVTIQIDPSNVFDVTTLQSLIEQSREGTL